MKYNIYIPSKGRPNCRTAQSLDAQNIPFKIFVEQQDYEDYLKIWGSDRVVNLGGNDYGCASHVRRAIKKYSTENGEEWHWQIDDDIKNHYEVVENKNVKKTAAEVFTQIEEFAESYTNIGIIGLSSSAFNKLQRHEYQSNVFAYGNVLIKNDDRFWWVDKTVEDLDYCLQVLTANMCTVRFNKFAFDLVSTGTNTGGYHEIDAANDLRNVRIDNTIDRWDILTGWEDKKHSVEGYDRRVKTRHVWRTFKHSLIPKNPENSLF